MNMQMNVKYAEQYSNNAQKIRVMTEAWVTENMFCPCCGNKFISHFENNRPVADFFCPLCDEEYELKSKSAAISNKVTDGAYNTMIERITSTNNPNFFFMHYSKSNLTVRNFVMVPKYFFTPEIIEKRKPLTNIAKRAGWTGCNILLNQVPVEGRIFIIQNERELPVRQIIDKVHRTEFLRTSKLDVRGWTLDVMNCINKFENSMFTLEQMYKFEQILSIKHPENHHVRDKIRQQLQVLRDNGIIEFVGRGHYRKIQ